MDWAVIAGIAAGLGSGLLGSWFGPFAQQRAEEAKARTQARRDIVAIGRKLVAEQDWEDPWVTGTKPDFVRIRSHLSDGVQAIYEWPEHQDDPKHQRPNEEIHRQRRGEYLTAEMDLLERKWKLI